MYLEIELPVYCLTEDQEILIESGKTIPVEEILIKNITFYNIENIEPVGELTTLICSGGNDYTVNETYQNLKKRIREAKIPNFS